MLVHIFEADSVAIEILLDWGRIRIREVSKGDAISLEVNVFETTPSGLHGLHQHHEDLPYVAWAEWEVMDGSLLIFEFYINGGKRDGDLEEISFIFKDGKWSLRE